MTYNKAYYETNKEKFKLYTKKYYEKNKEEHKIRLRKYYLENKEQHNKRCKKYYQMHKEEHKKRCKEYYEANKEEHKKRCKKYYEKNKDILKANIYNKNKYKLLNSLVKCQIDSGLPDKTLSYTDLRRISLKLTNSIFGSRCSIWKGRIRQHHGKYTSFYFKGKKRVLHRLLYINYVEPLEDSEYISFTCKHPGCCNVSHMFKKKGENIEKLLTLQFE